MDLTLPISCFIYQDLTFRSPPPMDSIISAPSRSHIALQLPPHPRELEYQHQQPISHWQQSRNPAAAQQRNSLTVSDNRPSSIVQKANTTENLTSKSSHPLRLSRDSPSLPHSRTLPRPMTRFTPPPLSTPTQSSIFSSLMDKILCS